MKVVMNCLPLASGGGIAIVRNLVPLLAGELGSRIAFLMHIGQADLVPTLKPQSMICVSEPAGGWKRLVWERRWLGGVVKRTGANVLFTPYQAATLVPGVKNVLMLTNMEPFLHARFRYGAVNRLRNIALQLASIRALRAAERVIAISRFTAHYLEHEIGVPSQRIRMIYHGRTEAMAPVEDANPDIAALRAVGMTEPFVLTAGSLLPYRRCEDVVAAFEQSANVLPPETRLAIAGTGNDRRYMTLLNRLIASSPVGNRISLLGHVPQPVMAALYRRCLVCVVSSEIEACPNIAIEAMTAGSVIVSTDKPPLPEMFAGAATLYRARTIHSLADAVAKSVSSLELRAKMRARALQRCKNFCWAQSARETCDALTVWP